MTNTPAITMDDKAAILLEEARAAHENYLIKQQDADLEKAIEYYIDAIKLTLLYQNHITDLLVYY